MDNRYLLIICIMLSFLLGALGMWAYQTHAQQTSSSRDLLSRDGFEDRFFDRSPFANIDRLHQQLNHGFGGGTGLPGFPGFGEWFDWRKDTGSVASIQTEEDDEHLFYVLNVNGKDVANFEVKTADGYVSIDAELKANRPGSSFSQTIKQQFPIPASVNPDTLHVEQLDGEIRMRFDKLG